MNAAPCFWTVTPFALTFVVLLLTSTPAFAEEQPAAWTQGRAVADWTSTALVGAQITAAVVTAWRAPDRGHALKCVALQNGVSVAGAETLKRTVGRPRPDGSDRFSWPSEHTWLAGANVGWKFQIGIPLEIGAGYLRMAADKHYATDVISGALLGELTRRLCHD